MRGSEFDVPPKSAHESDAARVNVFRMTSPWNYTMQSGSVKPASRLMQFKRHGMNVGGGEGGGYDMTNRPLRG
jgi:hypothetical protein